MINIQLSIFKALLLAIVSFTLSSVGAQESVSESEPKIMVPKKVLVGEPLDIQVHGLKPNQKVGLEAHRIWGWSSGSPFKAYRSIAWFRADASGRVEVNRQAPLTNKEGDKDNNQSSSYQGVEPMGMIWSMKAVSDDKLEKPTKDLVQFRLLKAPNSEANEALEVLASANTELIVKHDSVIETPLSDDPALEGTFVMKMPSQKPLPVVIIFGGSEGGDSGARSMAPIFASRGYAAIGFPYYAPAYGKGNERFSNLPRSFTEIPLDRVEKVLDLIAKDPMLDADRVGLYGVSKGGEFVLALSSRIDRFKAVVAVVPSDVIWEGWGVDNGPKSCFCWKGKPLPYVPYKGMEETLRKMRSGEKVSMRVPHDAGRKAFPDRVKSARIEVENIKAALMVVGGEKDQVWDSGGMCKNIVKTRQRAGLKTESWISPVAGHYISGPAYQPMNWLSAEASFRTKTFPAMLDFYSENL